jgi:hypothetical protein
MKRFRPAGVETIPPDAQDQLAAKKLLKSP